MGGGVDGWMDDSSGNAERELTLLLSRIQLPPGWRRGMFPQSCSVGGLFPQQIPAQSVQSSGRDERGGHGGDAATHFTGKKTTTRQLFIQAFLSGI